MVRPVKKKQIPNLGELIKETAWKQIAELGGSSLSLRAIARELNISAPAIYNYLPDRDALVTALSLTPTLRSVIPSWKRVMQSLLKMRRTACMRSAWPTGTGPCPTRSATS